VEASQSELRFPPRKVAVVLGIHFGMGRRGLYGFWEIAEDDPEAIVVVDVDGREWSAREMLDGCHRLAGLMKARGLKPGDSVAVALEDSAFFLQLCLAALQSGFHFVPLNSETGEAELDLIRNDSGASLFVDENSVEVLLKESVSYPSKRPLERTSGSLLFYTSGTTGRPRAIQKPLSGEPPEQLGKFAAVHLNAVCGIRPRSGCVHLVASPLYHSASLLWCVDHLHLGHQVVLAGGWDSENFLKLGERYQVTGSLMVPTHFFRLLQLPPQIRRRYSTESFRHIVHTGAPCPVSVKREMMDWWGPVIYEVYGTAEGGGTRVKPQEWLSKPGTVGKSFGRIRVLDEEGSDCPPGVVGRVFIKLARAVFVYSDGEERADQGRHEGFFTVGDLGFLDEDDYLFLRGRQSGMIVTGGVNVSPAEVEAVLRSHRQLADVLVLGVSDEEFGELVTAVVEPSTFPYPESLEMELRELAERGLVPAKRPRRYEIVERLERNQAGKVTHQTRARFRGRSGASADSGGATDRGAGGSP